MHLNNVVVLNHGAPVKICYAILLFALVALSAQADVIISSPHWSETRGVRSWKALRDQKIVKQDLDYSCGAASLATILNSYYGKQVSEAELLKAMNKADGMASFADMAAVLTQYGFKGVGMALSFEQLAKLKMPAVVYLRHRGDDHFSVLRGVNSEGHVHLGDPSWGNRIFAKNKFLAMWETRDDDVLKGKILLVVPIESGIVEPSKDFFEKPKSVPLPIELLGLRRF